MHELGGVGFCFEKQYPYWAVRDKAFFIGVKTVGILEESVGIETNEKENGVDTFQKTKNYNEA